MGVRSRRILPTVLALVVLQSCGTDPDRVCTAIGGTNGIGLAISKGLFVSSGRVSFKVCDPRGCVTTDRPLGQLPSDVPTPVGRGAGAAFAELGRRFGPGPVTVTATLFGPSGHRVATRTTRVKLARTYPNGKACDGDGYVSGGLTLRAADRVT